MYYWNTTLWLEIYKIVTYDIEKIKEKNEYFVASHIKEKHHAFQWIKLYKKNTIRWSEKILHDLNYEYGYKQKGFEKKVNAN